MLIAFDFAGARAALVLGEDGGGQKEEHDEGDEVEVYDSHGCVVGEGLVWLGGGVGWRQV